MALHWPTFFTRLGSAIIFSAIMMTGLLWNEWAFVGLAMLIMALCLRDYFRLIPKIDPDLALPQWLMPFTVLAGVIFLILFSLYSFGITPNYAPVAFCFPILLLLIAALSPKTVLREAAYSFGGIFYIILPMILFIAMQRVHFAIPLALVLMIWMNDTMAYLVGSFIGKTPFSKISPKKTWEGTAGGALLTIIGAAVWGYYSPVYKPADWIALAFCAAIAGTAGDLLESKLKRLADVKDSGTMMPGHGGALDRFDSLLVAVPFAFVYVYCFM